MFTLWFKLWFTYLCVCVAKVLKTAVCQQNYLIITRYFRSFNMSLESIYSLSTNLVFPAKLDIRVIFVMDGIIQYRIRSHIPFHACSTFTMHVSCSSHACSMFMPRTHPELRKGTATVIKSSVIKSYY